MGRTIDKALKKAKQRRVDYALIVGETEQPKDKVTLIDLSGRTLTEMLTIDLLIEKLKKS